MTKPEPLKDRISKTKMMRTVDCEGWEIFTKDAIKSALEWMIQAHEEEINYLISILDYISLISVKQHFMQPTILKQIDREYESIMILEEGLSDVI